MTRARVVDRIGRVASTDSIDRLDAIRFNSIDRSIVSIDRCPSTYIDVDRFFFITHRSRDAIDSRPVEAIATRDRSIDSIDASRFNSIDRSMRFNSIQIASIDSTRRSRRRFQDRDRARLVARPSSRGVEMNRDR